MTLNEAFEEAQRRWGPSASAYHDNCTNLFQLCWYEEIDREFELNCCNGDSWEAAFADADSVNRP
jgi:hypothetical protein